MGIAEELVALKSYKAVEDVLNDIILDDFQCVDVLLGLYFKKAMYMYDTGLGKTLIASAIMRMLVNEVPSRRFIWVVQKSQLTQTPKKIQDATGLRVLAVSAEVDEVDVKLLRRDFTKYPVLMITQHTLNHPTVMRLLYENKGYYCGIFVDEAHDLNNFEESSSAFMLRAILRNFEYRYALTATPVTSKLGQVVNLAHMFAWDYFSDVKYWTRYVEEGNSIVSQFPNFFINRNRSDLGIISNYRPHIELVDPEPHQFGVQGLGLMKITKGPGALPQAEKLASIIMNHRPHRGLVYINQHAVRDWVTPILDKYGIKYACINGRTKMSDRSDIMEDFAKGVYDVVITSVTTALDLDCDYIVFYEFCTDIKQMMGRAQRGLNPKTLDLHFIFTRDTGEIEYFLEYIYRRSLSIQEVLRKDYSELIRAGQMLAEEASRTI